MSGLPSMLDGPSVITRRSVPWIVKVSRDESLVLFSVVIAGNEDDAVDLAIADLELSGAYSGIVVSCQEIVVDNMARVIDFAISADIDDE